MFAFYKAIWFWFLRLPRAGKVLVGIFLIFAVAISSLANSGQKFSSSNSNFSSLFSSSSEKSTETLAKLPDGVETVKPQETKTSQETAENQKNLIISSQKSTVANTDDAIKSLLSNTEDAIKTDSAKIAQTQNKKLYQILEVVDGDTVKISEIGTLRLIGIDTPETKDPRKVVQCFGKEASENAKKLLSGQKVWLEFDESKSKTDKYGRTLAYIFREDGYFYNLEAVKNGFAHSYREYPHPRLDEFNLAEKQAREGKIGFWADNTCQGNTTQGVAGEAAKATVPPIGGTQEKTSKFQKKKFKQRKELSKSLQLVFAIAHYPNLIQNQKFYTLQYNGRVFGKRWQIAFELVL